MFDNEHLEKRYNYKIVEVSRCDDLKWIRELLADFVFSKASIIDYTEYRNLLKSLAESK